MSPPTGQHRTHRGVQAGAAAAADAVLNGTLESRDCGVRLALGAETQHLERNYAKATRYTLVISALTFVQVCLGAPGPCARRARGP